MKKEITLQELATAKFEAKKRVKQMTMQERDAVINEMVTCGYSERSWAWREVVSYLAKKSVGIIKL